MLRKSPFSAWLLALSVFVVMSCANEAADSVPPSDEVAENVVEGQVLLELLSQLTAVEEKMLGLAESMPQEVYEWRPDEGVRSGGEVLMHVLTINFVFPLFAGHEAPASTGLTMESLPSAAPALEASLQLKQDILPELRRSFEHLSGALEATPSSELNEEVFVMGQPVSTGAFWADLIGHLREHLGQLIAYARMNEVTPLWS